jgi:hypothetical protein
MAAAPTVVSSNRATPSCYWQFRGVNSKGVPPESRTTPKEPSFLLVGYQE